MWFYVYSNDVYVVFFFFIIFFCFVSFFLMIAVIIGERTTGI